MDNLLKRPVTSVPASTSTPARVRLKRINCREAQPYPPDGQKAEWWQRLKSALGTSSSAFVNVSLVQLVSAARLPGGGISEMAVNAALAFIESAKPRDEVESALLMQMACTHIAAMAMLGRLAEGSAWVRNVPPMASAASRLLRAYAMQVEALRRLRNGGSQFVRVEHVHVNERGQAIVGNVHQSIQK